MTHTHLIVNHSTIVLFIALMLLFCQVACSPADSDNTTVKGVRLIKTLAVPGELLMFSEGQPPMNTYAPRVCFLSEQMSFWQASYHRVNRYSLQSNSFDFIIFDFNTSEKWTNTRRSESRICKNGNRIKESITVSSDEQYILFRFSPFTSELYELKTKKRLFDSIGDEMIIGFGPPGTVYCYHPSIENMFFLRDIQTGEVQKTYNTELLAEDITFTQDNQLDYLPSLVPQSTIDGKYTVFFLISNESENKGLVLICDNETNSAVKKSSVGLQWPEYLRPLISEDNKFIAIPNGTEGVLLYDFKNQRFHHLKIPSEQHRVVSIQGFCFTPDNRVILWIRHSHDLRAGTNEYPTSYQYDLNTYECTPFEDYSSPERYTHIYYSNAPKDIVITYERIPGQMQVIGDYIGKYVFWDFKTKQRIFETQAKYRPNIVVSPDGNHVYLTSTEHSLDEYQGMPRVLTTVDVFEVQ